ncbi:hypothetical protein PHYNN_174 [Pantoea phage Phynn]|nr:hypothetical protein PHYNN_174 [Pantoea phage Phynn]
MKQETAVHMPSYKLGDAIQFYQFRDVPFNLFRLRKELEKVGFNEYPVEVVYSETMDLAGKVAYAIGVPMQATGAKTHEEFNTIIAGKLNVEPTGSAIGNAFYNIIMRAI